MYYNTSSSSVATVVSSTFSSSATITSSLISAIESSSLVSPETSSLALSSSSSLSSHDPEREPLLLTTSSSTIPSANASSILPSNSTSTGAITSSAFTATELQSNATTTPPLLQTPPSAGFSTTLSLNGTGFNSTNSSADAYADACDSASRSFLSRYATVTIISTSTYTLAPYYTYTFIPPTSTPYTTLCDGIPRAHGTPIFSAVTVTPDSDSYTYPTTTWDPVVATPPACTINQSQCNRLYSSWDFVETDRPACDFSDPGCTTASSTCYISAQSVQMAYWPVSVTGDPCGNRTTIPPTVTTPQTATIFGTTVVSPNVLLSFDTLVLEDACTNPVSTVTNFILEQRPDQVSSQAGEYHGGYGHGLSFNFGNFQSPVPARPYLDMYMCGLGGGGFKPRCSTIWDAYTPQLAIPTDVQNAGPAFAGCGFLDDLNLVFDPPIALTAAANEALPTLPGGSSPTSATALPEKTPQPTLPPSTSTPAESKPSTPPPAQPSPSDSPSPASPAPADPPSSPQSPSNQNGNPSPSPPSNQNGGSNPTSPSNGNGNSDPSSPSNQNGNSDPSSPQSPSNQNSGSDPSPAQDPPASANTTPANVGGIVASAIGASSAPAAQNGNGNSQGQGGSGSNQQQPGSSNGRVTTVGSIPLSAAPGQSAVVVDGTATLTPGQTTVINQTPVSVGSSGLVVVGSSTVNLAAPTQAGNAGNSAVLTLGGSTVTASSLSGGGVVIQGQTIAPGQTVVVDGQTISVGSSGIVVNGATQAFSPLGSAATPASAAIITAGGQTFAAQASAGTVVFDGTTLTPGQVATINGAIVSDASSGIVVDGSTALFTPAASGQAGPITAIMRFGSQTMTATESSGTAVISGTTLTPGELATIDGHVVSDVSSGLIVDGTTSLWSGGSGPVTQVMALGDQDITVTESAGTATIDSSITLRPGDMTSLDGHVVSDASSGFVIDGSSTSLFADASASTTVVTIGSHIYTATKESNGALVVSGHTLSPGGVATIDREMISDAGGKLAGATPVFASSLGGNAGPAATPSKGAAASTKFGVVEMIMSACCLALAFSI